MLLKVKDFAKHFASVLEKNTSFRPSYTPDGAFLELRAESIGVIERMARIGYTADRSGVEKFDGSPTKMVGPPYTLRMNRTYEVTSDLIVVPSEGWPEGVMGMVVPHPSIVNPPFIVVNGPMRWQSPNPISYRLYMSQDIRMDMRVPVCVLVLFSVDVPTLMKTTKTKKLKEGEEGAGA